jgi:hypothetical protein
MFLQFLLYCTIISSRRNITTKVFPHILYFKSKLTLTLFWAAIKRALSGSYKFIKPSRQKAIWPPAAQNSNAKDMCHQGEQSYKQAEISAAKR